MRGINTCDASSVVSVNKQTYLSMKGGSPNTCLVPSMQKLRKGFRVHINQVISVVKPLHTKETTSVGNYKGK